MIVAHTLSHQSMYLDYCLEASIRSAMDLCDEVYINEGRSTDGTLPMLYELQKDFPGRLKIFEREWSHTRRMWTDERNFLIDKTPNDAYIFCIDGDEVIHESDIPTIKQAIDKKYPAIAFDMIHFYGRPTHYIEGSAWYKLHTRIWNKKTGIRLVHRDKGCADDVLWPDGTPAHWSGYARPGVKLYHYGNCRNPKALGRKSKKADDLYQYSEAYVGGLLAEPRSFDYGFETVGAKEFKGTHPKYVQSWVEQHKDQPTVYIAGDGKIAKLWCFEEN
jgi:hypothetical protein